MAQPSAESSPPRKPHVYGSMPGTYSVNMRGQAHDPPSSGSVSPDEQFDCHCHDGNGEHNAHDALSAGDLEPGADPATE